MEGWSKGKWPTFCGSRKRWAQVVAYWKIIQHGVSSWRPFIPWLVPANLWQKTHTKPEPEPSLSAVAPLTRPFVENHIVVDRSTIKTNRIESFADATMKSRAWRVLLAAASRQPARKLRIRLEPNAWEKEIAQYQRQMLLLKGSATY